MNTNVSVLVTGASGCVGSAVLARLLCDGHVVRAAMHRARSASEDRAVVEHTFDLALDSDWGAALEGVTSIVHCAARVHVVRESAMDPLAEFRRVNVTGTLNLAQQAVAAGIRRFIFISSIGVNGAETCGKAFTTDDIPAPQSPYAVSKHEAEQGLWKIARDTGLEVVVVRPPLVYGPRVKGNFLRLLRLSASGLPLPLGSVSGLRSLVSVWNLCDLIARCLHHPAAAGGTFLASDDNDITVPNLVHTLAASMGRPCRLFPAPPALVRVGAMALGKGMTFDKLTASLQVDISETKRILDWEPPLPLAEGLARTAQWYAQTALVKGTSSTAR